MSADSALASDELKALDERHAQRQHQLKIPLMKKYIAKLETLKKELVRSRRFREALHVKREQDRIKQELGEHAGSSGSNASSQSSSRQPATAESGAVSPGASDAAASSGVESVSVEALPLWAREFKATLPGSAVLLLPGKATRDGDNPRSTGDGAEETLTHWKLGGTASWTLPRLKSGAYTVFLDYACGRGGGGAFEIDLGGVKFPVNFKPSSEASMDDWQRFSRVPAGKVTISGGTSLTLRMSATRVEGKAAADVRRVILVPSSRASAVPRLESAGDERGSGETRFFDL